MDTFLFLDDFDGSWWCTFSSKYFYILCFGKCLLLKGRHATIFKLYSLYTKSLAWGRSPTHIPQGELRFNGSLHIDVISQFKIGLSPDLLSTWWMNLWEENNTDPKTGPFIVKYVFLKCSQSPFWKCFSNSSISGSLCTYIYILSYIYIYIWLMASPEPAIRPGHNM